MIFFQSEQACIDWVQTMPPIMRVLDGEKEHDELADDVELPTFYNQQYLILRERGIYKALERVKTREEADFTWYVATSPEEGEEVFATYLLDRRQDPPVIVEGLRIQEAKAAIDAFLDAQKHRLTTVRLWLLPQRQ